MTSARALAALAAPCLVALASSAARADGFSADRFHPAPAGDSFFGVESVATRPPASDAPHEEGDLRAALVFDYARAPLVLRLPSSEGALEVGKLVSHQAFAHADVAYAVGDRLLLSVDAPFLLSGGSDPASALLAGVRVPSGSALGDVRLAARVHLLGAPDAPFQLALADAVSLPTGDPQLFTGDGRVDFEPSVVVGGLVDESRGIWSASAGVRLRPEHEILDVRTGNELTFGAAYALTAWRKRVSLGLETFGAVGVGPSTHAVAAELLVDARVRLAPWFVGVAAGPGLTSAVGTPSFRVVATAGWAAF